MLAVGGDAVSQVPVQRWNAPRQPSAMRFGSFIAGAERFDGPFFSVSPAEADAMDPQQRLVLEFGYGALHSAGLRRDGLQSSVVGIFLGIMSTDYSTLCKGNRSVYDATGGTISVAAGRLSFTLGIQGPCASLDTACSSALVALHLATTALRLDECTMALSLAVNIMLIMHAHEAYARAGMLSADGRCKTFDMRANGYVRGEGIGAAVLAIESSEELHTIRGSAVRSDGRSASLTAPNGTAQTRMIGGVVSAAGVECLHLVEAHGTGTRLGDLTEVVHSLYPMTV